MKTTVNQAVSEELCTGCGACMNVCPVAAINMSQNKEGFLYPHVNNEVCIECGKCEKCCPVLHDENKNTKTPRIFAVRANDNVRSVSSSGGVFTVFANDVLENDGVVCGAAFDKDMQLKHMIVDRKDCMGKLRGSKYLQSNMGTIYNEIKNILDIGRMVLFTGTPCQIAALKSVLGREYENLLTIDILCHGVPSQKVFTKYLSEISSGKQVQGVDFRNKRFGWQSSSVLVSFSDKTEYIGNVKNDPFEVGFYRNLFLRKSCSNCKFSEYPRQGDLSMGDFWGINEIDPSQNDAKGTSILFINSLKGKKAFEQVRNTFYQVKEFPFKDICEKIKNRTYAVYPANKNREKFFNIFSETDNLTQSIKTALPRSLNNFPSDNSVGKKHDIGLVSNYLAKNFGGSLTQYALYNVLKKMGYSVGMIERPLSAPEMADFSNFEKMYLECPYDMDDILPRYADKSSMEQLNQICDKFVVGSDQLFQQALYKQLDKFVSLSWVEDSKSKIAYAGSFGHGKVWGAADDLAEFGYFLKKFDAFSVRERDAVDICKKNFDVDAEWVLDPVFLCDKRVYENLAKKSSRKLKPHYIASYMLDPSEDKQQILRTVMNELNLPIEIYTEILPQEAHERYTKPLGDLNTVRLTVEERLQSIMNCDFFVTDSFHGTCFAIMMGKPFISILNARRGGSRFYSLLETFGLQSRLVKDNKDFEAKKELLNTPIDYTKVSPILLKERKRCILWLKAALNAPKKNVYSEYDMMKKLIKEQQKTIDFLEKKIQKLSILTGNELSYITDFNEYLGCLNNMKKESLILIAVKDTPGLSVTPEVSAGLKKLGIENDMCGKHGRSFAAVIDCGKKVFEKLGLNDEQIDVAMAVKGLQGKTNPIHLVSRVFKNGNEARIEYNDKNYSVNNRGFNIVTISRKNGMVLDSVCFDTHLRKYNYFRRDDF